MDYINIDKSTTARVKDIVAVLRSKGHKNRTSIITQSGIRATQTTAQTLKERFSNGGKKKS